MKYLTAITLLLSLSACATSRDVHHAPCDAVANRDKRFVCGEDKVVKECNPVVGTEEFVCQPL
jgi:hypothetical protein